MSDFKQVNVRLSPLDQKTLSRTPKRGVTRKQKAAREQPTDSLLLHESDTTLPKEDVSASLSIPPATLAKPTSESLPKPMVAQKPTPEPAVAQKSVSTPEPAPKPKKIVSPPLVQEPAVHIQAKPVPDVKLASPKILPNKKRPTDVPAILTKKSKFVISPVQNRPKPSAPVSDSNKEPGANKTMKKHYKERKISIQIRTNDQTKRFKHKLDQEIPALPIANVKKFLLKSGVLKLKKTYPPEEILRSMMRDYMLLHTIE
jgi:hypothetical protein